jgi:hypothetical protein
MALARSSGAHDEYPTIFIRKTLAQGWVRGRDSSHPRRSHLQSLASAAPMNLDGLDALDGLTDSADPRHGIG